MKIRLKHLLQWLITDTEKPAQAGKQLKTHTMNDVFIKQKILGILEQNCLDKEKWWVSHMHKSKTGENLRRRIIFQSIQQ